MKGLLTHAGLVGQLGIAGLVIACGEGGGSSPTAPGTAATSIEGRWTGTQNSLSSTSGSHCVHQLLANLIADNRLKEGLDWEVTQALSSIHVKTWLSGVAGGGYEGHIDDLRFSASYRPEYGALLLPTYCSGKDFKLIEEGGALDGQVGSGILTGTGTRRFGIFNNSMNKRLGEVTISYQYSLRK